MSQSANNCNRNCNQWLYSLLDKIIRNKNLFLNMTVYLSMYLSYPYIKFVYACKYCVSERAHSNFDIFKSVAQLADENEAKPDNIHSQNSTTNSSEGIAADSYFYRHFYDGKRKRFLLVRLCFYMLSLF